jgi:hypothetical protein
MKTKALLLIAALAAIAHAQVSGAGNLGCNAATVTGTAWNSSTSLNATQQIATSSPFAQYLVELVTTSTITAGIVTVEGEYGSGTYGTAPASYTVDASNQQLVANPYTLVATTDKAIIVTMGGYKSIRLKLSTQITGSGTLTPYFTPVCTPVIASAVYNSSLPTLSNGQAGQLQLDVNGRQLADIGALNGTTVDTNSGSKSAGTQRVVLATDQPALSNKLLVTPDSVALPSHQSVNVDQANGTTLDTNSGSKSAGTIRVVLATDQPALSNKLLVTPDLPSGASTAAKQPALGTAGTPSADVITIQGVTSMTPLSANLMIGGTAIDGNSGNKSAQTQRMVLATDQPNLTTPLNVAIAANQSANVAQINGVTPLMGNGTTGTGSQRVTIASDNTAFSVNAAATLQAETTKVIGTVRNVGNVGGAFDAATGAAPPANALYMGGLGSGATGGLVQPVPICDQWVAINGTASATLITGVSGRKIYVCSGNIQMNGGANTVSFVSGTGTVCATGITAIPGFDGATTAANGYSFAPNSGMAFGGGLVPFARTTNNADNLCILVGSATRVAGGLAYAIY